MRQCDQIMSTLRQVCARSFSRPGAHNLLNLGECARLRQVRQVFFT